ncbi:PHD zinc finger protein [Teratosphaeria destructans]|uniref:PHD zinc finger protein n=1 Tax=Teratosphaeria destructans TaxID=418781 RepID=A0A9W7T0Z5_9PEZI|nr:PHD zinc finger protein [Teratosphaeria destructans]
MSASERQRHFIAKFCLSKDISKRVPPPFLRRNIETALDAHERLLGKTTNDASEEPMSPNGRRGAVFEWPTRSALNNLMQKPAMRIDALQIRKLSGSGDARWRKPRRKDVEVELDWVPDPDTGLVLPCRFKVDIIAKTQSGGRKLITSLESRAIITQHATDDDEQFFDVKMHEPLLIPVDRLFANIDGDRHWEQRIAEDYTMDMSFHLENSESGAQFLGVLESRVSTDLAKIQSHEMRVKATWSDLPSCPRNQLLPLMRASSRKIIPLQYGLDVQIGWPQRRRTPLEMHNQAVNLANGQLPTSTSLQALNSGAIIIRYCYSVQQGSVADTRVKTRDKLTCIFCEHSPAFRDVERLLGHYNLYHRQFHWKLDGQTPEVGGKEVVTITMKMSHEISGDEESEEDHVTEFDIVQPEKPFDLKAYNAGDRTWVESVRLRAPRESSSAPAANITKQRGRSRKRQDPGTASASPAPMAAVATAQKRPALDLVPDLPTPKRKKYVVPHIPGTTFYHSLSKQPMMPGEEFCESDDEMYDDRLAEAQRVSMLELGLTADEQDFYAAYNRHLDFERSGSKIFISEGMVRFTRKHSKDLQHPAWRRTFAKKLDHLVAHRVIGHDVMEYCMSLVTRDAEAGAEAFGPDLHEKRDGHDSAVDVGDEAVADSLRLGMPEPSLAYDPGTSSALRKDKSRKWGGTGADEDIMRNGFGTLQSAKDDAPPSASDFSTASMHHKNDGSSKKRMVYDTATGGFVERTGPDSHVALNRRTGSPSGITASASVSAAPTSILAEQRRRTIGHDQIDRNGVRPIALERVKCWRHGDTRDKLFYHVLDFVKIETRKQVTSVEPRDISFRKFLGALSKDFGYNRRLDIVRYQPMMRDPEPVETVADWVKCLTLCRDCNYELRFEIRRVRNQSETEASTSSETNATNHEESRDHQPAAQASGSKSTSNNRVSIKCICVCDKRANKGRGSVACGNMDCKRQWFHLACVGLERPLMDWRCADCAAVDGP